MELQREWNSLLRTVQSAGTVWNDEARRRFEREHWAPVADSLSRALREVDEFRQVAHELRERLLRLRDS